MCNTKDSITKQSAQKYLLQDQQPYSTQNAPYVIINLIRKSDLKYTYKTKPLWKRFDLK